ncbi:hypothetical protein [Rhodovulum euryhalinum]|uniref:Uncharacterized protein n=1 Tax=Rhodovulum euryhalinum TaxID=35805 RepID=A0A4R2KS22_9RHOB|nr:hypothetical protein [Rhodovulum euryhalinum]TCO72938.1 hypothetical protein EV655_103167 [Rhodovulum euryhalinum]
MVEIAEIRDGKTFRAWLDQEDLPREAMVALAHRAAMRVLPVWWSEVETADWARKRELTALPVCRTLLTSGSSACAEDPDVKGRLAAASSSAAAAASSAFADASSSAAAAASSSAAAAASSAFAFADAADADAFAAAAAASSSAADAADAVWAALREDCAAGADVPQLVAAPLWHAAERPFDAPWQSLRATYPPDGDHPWAFWIDWYQRALDGTETRWDLLRRIALIDDAIWEAGPDAVAAEIARLQGQERAQEIIDQTPYGLRVVARPRKGVLVSEPAEVVDLSEIVERIRQALKDFTARCRRDKSANRLGPQMKTALDPAISDLRRDLRRHATDPHQLFDALRHAQNELARTAHREGFPNEGAVERLTDELQTLREDIAVAAPSVVEVERKRLDVRLRLVSQDHKLAALRLLAGLGADSEGFLRIATQQALLTVLDEGADDEARRNAWYFMLAIVPRGAREMTRAELEPATPKKAKDFLDGVAQTGDKLAKIDKGVDALQEMVPEGVDWVTEAWTQIGSGNLWGLLG